tara:strand:- start:158 stop:607 length:450 start_codon:yes stop_codon:yes gene_type:complete
MKKALIIFFVTLFFSTNVYSNEKINDIYNYLKKQDKISLDTYLKIASDFYYVIDIFKDYSYQCDNFLRMFDTEGWKKDSCIRYRKKVLPSIEKIKYIGRKWIEPSEGTYLTTEQKIKHSIYRRTVLRQQFDYEFGVIMAPYRRYEAINY